MPIKHIFVLMLENRSFDHMLGFSGITGINAEDGQPTRINGLSGTESNIANGVTYPVTRSAPSSMPFGPGHEFEDICQQLTGQRPAIPPAPPARFAYPPITGAGFAATYARVCQPNAPTDIMRGFTPAELPVLNSLANEFAVCDAWFSSMPGPTWPNRFFAMAGSSGGLDHSPTNPEILEWETVRGFEFANGTIFDQGHISSRIYCGGILCIAQTMKGITFHDVHHYSDFVADISNRTTPYAPQFTFIEPDYGDLIGGYKGGSSQHPLDNVSGGEKLIKQVYEALRASPIWEESLLILTWDEHGGFYDHVVPPAAVAPGDATRMAVASAFGFDFTQYGVRVPALVISPLVPKNTIDHRLYDHTSILASAHKLFGGAPLTQREAKAHDVLSLASLPAARPTPLTLPEPVAQVDAAAAASVDRSAPVAGNNLPGFFAAAIRNHLHMELETERDRILAEARALATTGEVHDYINAVENKVKAWRNLIP